MSENPIIRGDRLPRLTPSHVILQFDQSPTAAALDALRARGAVVLQDVPENGVLVLMTGTTVLDGLGIRSARRLDPREKISPLITEGNASAASGTYLVEFHPDVDPNAARRLILNAGLELRENPDLLRQHLMVHIPNTGDAGATLASLASQDQVAYIFPAAANLAAGAPASVCGGALSVLGPIGQLIATNGNGWDGPGLNAATLNYVFQTITTQLPTGVPQGEIVRAMAEWAKVVQVTWQPGTDSLGNRTVNILWATGDHGDGFPFDGVGGVVAHTFYPSPPNPEPLAGDMHFDDAESWHVGAQVDVFSVALHELGHALGLGHSDNPNDVMYPYLKIVTGLADGDKTAILGLYAAQTGSVPPPAALTLTINAPPATTTAATISLTGTVTGGSGSPVVTWSTSAGASDGSSITGSIWVSSSIPLALGVNTIIVTATDANGSTSHVVSVTQTGASAPGSLALTINAPPSTTTAATISLTGTVAGGSSAPAVTWITSTGASDGSTISGGNWSIFSIPLAMGLNTITVTATDSTGTISQFVSVTRTPAVAPGPLVLTINPPPSSTTNAAISLSGTIVGGNGSPKVTWVTNTGASDGSTISGGNWSIFSIPLAMGVNIVTVTAADASGSVSNSVTVTRVAALPPTPLVLTINVPPATTTDATVSLSGTVTGGSGAPAITWTTNIVGANGASISGSTWAIANIPLAIGVNVIAVTAADPTGSVTHIVSVTRTAALPPSPLVLTITTPPATTTAATMSLSGTVTGGSGGPAISWTNSVNASDGGSISGSGWVISNIPLTVGVNTITVTAADATGSVSQMVSVTRTASTTPSPLVLTITAPPATTTAATMSLSGTVTGGSGGPAISWTNGMGASDGGSISGSGWVISNIPLAIGVNTITVTAADATGSVSQMVSVTRTAATPPGGTDTTGPALTITSPSITSVATTLASLTFQGTASDPSGVRSVIFSTNTGGAGTASGTTAWSAVVPLLVGSNQVIIRAYDTAGNMSSRSVVVTRRP